MTNLEHLKILAFIVPSSASKLRLQHSQKVVFYKTKNSNIFGIIIIKFPTTYD